MVQLYDSAGPTRKFEIVLIGYDRDQGAVEAYLKKSHMNFPALKKDEIASVKTLAKTGDTGFIPNTVLIKPDGSLVSNDLEKVLQTLRGLQ